MSVTLSTAPDPRAHVAALSLIVGASFLFAYAYAGPPGSPAVPYDRAAVYAAMLAWGFGWFIVAALSSLRGARPVRVDVRGERIVCRGKLFVLGFRSRDVVASREGAEGGSAFIAVRLRGGRGIIFRGRRGALDPLREVLQKLEGSGIAAFPIGPISFRDIVAERVWAAVQCAAIMVAISTRSFLVFDLAHPVMLLLLIAMWWLFALRQPTLLLMDGERLHVGATGEAPRVVRMQDITGVSCQPGWFRDRVELSFCDGDPLVLQLTGQAFTRYGLSKDERGCVVALIDAARSG